MKKRLNGAWQTSQYGIYEPVHGNNFFDDSKSGMIQINAATQRYGTSLGTLQAGTYTISYILNSPNSNMFYGYRIGDTYQSGQIQNTSQGSASPYTVTLSSDVDDFFIRSARTNTSMSWAEQGYDSIMVNEGSEPLPYEPYHEDKIFVPHTEKKRVNGAWV